MFLLGTPCFCSQEILTIGDNDGNVSLINFQPGWHVCDGGLHLACKHDEPRRSGVNIHKVRALSFFFSVYFLYFF